MKKIWKYLSNQGITDDLSDRFSRKIRLTNQISTTIGFVMIFVVSNSYWKSPVIHFTEVSAGFLYAVPIISNRLKYFNFSRFFLNIYPTLVILFLAGISTNVNCVSMRFALISVILVPLLVFDVTERKKMYAGIVWVALCFIFMDIINSYIPQMPEIDSKDIDSSVSVMINGLLSFMMIIFSFSYFQNMNYKAEERLNKQNEDLEKKKIELTEQTKSFEIANNSITNQRNEIHKKNQQILSSITYAQRIQNAVLPGEQLIQALIPDNFIYNKPREIISGDFYFVKQVDENLFIAAGDCTGHGVPGSLMTILGLTFLNEIIATQHLTESNLILNELRKKIKFSLKQTGRESDNKDGMDVALCVINRKQNRMQYSGAFNPLIQISKGKLIEHKADRMPIGIHPKETSFVKTEIELLPDDIFYMFSDGYIDQFGGSNGEKYKPQSLKDLLFQIHNEPLNRQKEQLEAAHNKWRGMNEQTDDILVIGFKLA